MNPFRSLTRVFIDFFGITHPTPQQERRAAWYICSLVGLVLTSLTLICLTVYAFMRH